MAVGLAVCIGAIASAVSCSRSPANANPAGATPVREVELGRAVRRPMERTLSVSGWLMAREHSTLSVKVAGRVKWMGVDLGSPVHEGERLVQVEPRDYELREQQSRAALAQARAALGLPPDGEDDRIDLQETSPVHQARALLEEAKRTMDRVERLAEAGISSDSERDSAESSYTVAKERHEAALEDAQVRLAALAQRRAEYDLARQQLSDTTVKAPFAGVVQSRLAQLGEYLPAGSPVLVLVQTDPLRLRLEVPEREAVEVKAGQRVRLKLEGVSPPLEGTLARISPALREDTRMLVVEADIPNPGGLRPGQFAAAEVILNESEPALAVPDNALIVFAGLEKVVAVREGKAVEVPIVTGRKREGWIEVRSGLREGEDLVLNPGGVRTGQPVRPAAAPTTTNDLSHAETR